MLSTPTPAPLTIYVEHPGLDITGYATVILALVTLGVVVTGYLQLRESARLARVTATVRVLAEFSASDVASFIRKLDRFVEPAVGRRVMVRFLRLTRRNKRSLAALRAALLQVSTSMERIEIYTGHKVIEEELLLEHLDFDIVFAYYILEDTLRWFARTEDLEFRYFRELALRARRYYMKRPTAERLFAFEAAPFDEL